MDIKKDFPIFKNNPDLIYLDSTASSQKPDLVIDWIKTYLESSCSNIHRWLYDIAERSEKAYLDSKKKIVSLIWADSYKEIIYTYNSTYALNLISSSLAFSKVLKAWDKVLLSIVEHHANIVPWLILKEEIWIEIEYINVDENFNLDFDDFEKKYDEKVKVISITHVSNTTWQIFDLKKIWEKKRDDTIFIIDWSQSIPHFKINVSDLNADFMFFTWHKILADTWIWVLYWREELLEKINPSFSWGWAISKVEKWCFSYWKLPYKFEAWTPNISWAISLLKAIEYIEKIGWFEEVEKIENELLEYALEKFNQRKNIKLIWSRNKENRVWVFTFTIDWVHSNDIADYMAENNICVRSWLHCAHPFLNWLWINHSCRMSLYIYNTFEDIDKFFEVLDKII